MLKSALIAAAPMIAATLPTHSASMKSIKTKVDGMTVMKAKKMANSQMMMAKNDIEAHKMKFCSMRMDKAIKSMGSM